MLGPIKDISGTNGTSSGDQIWILRTISSSVDFSFVIDLLNDFESCSLRSIRANLWIKIRSEVWTGERKCVWMSESLRSIKTEIKERSYPLCLPMTSFFAHLRMMISRAFLIIRVSQRKTHLPKPRRICYSRSLHHQLGTRLLRSEGSSDPVQKYEYRSRVYVECNSFLLVCHTRKREQNRKRGENRRLRSEDRKKLWAMDWNETHSSLSGNHWQVKEGHSKAWVIRWSYRKGEFFFQTGGRVGERMTEHGMEDQRISSMLLPKVDYEVLFGVISFWITYFYIPA